MRSTRRSFIRNSLAISLGFSGLHQFAACGRMGDAPTLIPGLVEDPAGIIHLPPGFSYKIISRVGDTMSDGLMVPGLPDGMAAFPGSDNLTILVRNHEIGPNALEMSPFGTDNVLYKNVNKELLYDNGFGQTPSLGGTSTLVYDTQKQEVVHQYLSLCGTIRNCAGGPTPWNSWITCEETMDRADDIRELDHGYNFEVPATADGGLVKAVPLKAMGRFNHEAVAVSPETGIVYQTEDRHDSLIYRYIPETPGQLEQGGLLQALVLLDEAGSDTRNWDNPDHIKPGQVLPVTWIDMEDIQAPDDDLRLRGFEAGAARFARGEGMWTGDGVIYFACTNGGREKKGQIWKYHPSPFEGTPEEQQTPATLELFVEPNDGSIVENADNLTVAPWGDLVVCEDGPGTQNLLRITPAGEIIRFGTNAISESEFAGSCFSPDGSTLFVNIQGDGLTLAITGPWQQFGA